jgi:4-hydroxybenzoate polyprenyltransferase
VALAGMGPLGPALILWLALGAWAMRSAGCVWNDIVDRDLDARWSDPASAAGERRRASRGAWVLLAALPDRAARAAPARADGAGRRSRQPRPVALTRS